MTLPVDLRRTLARRRDAQLAGLVTATAGAACPFPIRVYSEPDYGRLVVMAGAAIVLATLTSDEAYATHAADPYLAEEALAIRLGRRAAEAYAGLTAPVPDNVTLGEQ